MTRMTDKMNEARNVAVERTERGSGLLNISPACKVFFPCKEGSGDVISDVVTTAEVTTSVPITWVGDTADFGEAVEYAVTNGFPEFTKDYSAFLLVAESYDEPAYNDFYNLAIGKTGGGASSLVSLFPQHASANTPTGLGTIFMGGSLEDEADTAPESFATMATFDYVAKEAKLFMDRGAGVTTDITDISDEDDKVSPTDFIYPYGIKLYGFAIFEFTDGIPDDIEEAFTWMRTQWLANAATGRLRQIYPPWMGLT